MKTLKLKQLKSGNYEIASSGGCLSFKTQKSFIEWYNENVKGYTRYRTSFGSRIIKARYRMSQTYFFDANEVINFVKKNNITFTK